MGKHESDLDSDTNIWAQYPFSDLCHEMKIKETSDAHFYIFSFEGNLEIPT